MSVEETVVEKLNRLIGAPRIAFLQKWRRWMLELVPPGVDPVIVYGYPLLDLDDVVEVLKEYCYDLVESECIKKIRELAVRPPEPPERRLEALAKDIRYQVKIQRREEKVRELMDKLNLSVPLPLSTLEEAYRLVQEGRVDEAVRLIRDRLVDEYGWPPEEALEEANKIRTMPRIEVKPQPVRPPPTYPLRPYAPRPRPRPRREEYVVYRPLAEYLTTLLGLERYIAPALQMYTLQSIIRTAEAYRKQLVEWAKAIKADLYIDVKVMKYNAFKVPSTEPIIRDLLTKGFVVEWDYRHFPPGSYLYYVQDPLACYGLHDYIIVCNQPVVQVAGNAFRPV